MRVVTSNFPYAIDDRIYFQCVSIDQVPTKTAYEGFYNNGQYTDASLVLNNANMDFYGASVLNMLENRIIAIENYVLTLIKPDLTAYQQNEPAGVPKNYTWIY